MVRKQTARLKKIKYVVIIEFIKCSVNPVYARLSIRPSRWNNLGSHWTDFHEIWYLNIFRKSAEKIQVSLKSDKNNGHFAWRTVLIYDNMSLNST